ncbi:hypothetical protein PV10_07751 [Exophiala mesophila]|uniref:protein O-GlcNAc transferase n=1 Tax=Exophiala mesophila TaxID=212818 RepID=A0A0D1Z8T2_EXOME|nr:uncharacterized protein PV10_07751 [Exophiala mesophila]KIV90444.1 hypothetical protein PV10_07751 [Exophiala mesophila]
MISVPYHSHVDMASTRDPKLLHRLPDNLGPRQYAIPAQTSLRHSGRQTSTSGLSYLEHEMLRQRKTPNGLLLEHDPVSLDKNVQVPALKHVILSSAPGYQPVDNLLTLTWSDLNPPYQPATFGTSSTERGVNQHHPYTLPKSSHRAAWDFPGGLDSVLNQALPLQPSQRYYVQPGSNVPTVLPATLHAQFGPTASAGQELYGPYWPDGTYNPYRPAAIRDSRLFPRPPTEQFPLDHLHRPLALQHGSRLPAIGTHAYHAHDPCQLMNPRLLPMESPLSSKWDMQQVIYPNQQQQQHQQQPYKPHYTPCDHPLTGSASITRPVLGPLRPGVGSERITFRDKSFAWANRIYTDLLETIRLNNKNQRGRSASHASSNNKLPIFPKPPKRSGSHFQEHPSDKSVRNDNLPPPFMRTHSDSSVHDSPSRPRTAIFQPQGISFSDSRQLRSDFTVGQSSATDYHQNDRTYSALQHHSQVHTPPIKRPPTFEEATSAQRTIELLCQEADTPWVDGMLLAGCLAYGLGNFAKAEEWYLSVLKQDKGHIEAMSNLAATYHALHRQDEALSYWFEAVKLRPSYFEAVEHLIGLLCASQRAAEAVQVIQYIEHALKIRPNAKTTSWNESSDAESDTRSHASSITTIMSYENAQYDFDPDHTHRASDPGPEPCAPGFGSSGFAISGNDNGRMLALIHAKGNMLYALNNSHGAASAFEDAVLIATGQRKDGVRGLIYEILKACLSTTRDRDYIRSKLEGKEPVLLTPEHAEATARHMFAPDGSLPGLKYVDPPYARQAAVSTTSNSLLSLAKIYQDGMSNATNIGSLKSPSTRDILALYYLSLSLQRSPSTANNVGILLAGVQQTVHPTHLAESNFSQISNIAGVVAGSGISLALMYYNYGLNIDQKHAHLFTNLGSLLKDIGQLGAAIKMYERAVNCDGKFDIALANLANAVKDQGRVADAITYYKRAVTANPEFAEAVCGLATALNSVCDWNGRGGICVRDPQRDRLHVDDQGMRHEPTRSYGWISRVVNIVEKQLKDGEMWGCGTLTPTIIDSVSHQLTVHRQFSKSGNHHALVNSLKEALQQWSGKKWEGSRLVRLVEKTIQRIGWQWYQDRYKDHKEYPIWKYTRPTLPNAISPPSAPTVLPFHTFTSPLSAKEVRQISQRNALRISVCTLRSVWLPRTVYPPPPPPRPCLNVGYVSSDFNNHPLAHLMQSVFGLHDPRSVRAICYATTASDSSTHRRQIEREAPIFHDASSWGVERLVNQIVQDEIHVLVNLNGYTRGARNEVFAARPAPIHMSFMGFAGTLGAEWCDYVFADSISVPSETLSPWRRNVDLEDRLRPDALAEDAEDWVYAENVIFARDTFFCVDHKQSAPDAANGRPNYKDSAAKDDAWEEEQTRRWKLRKELFPTLSNTAVILGNFNQLYKIDPSTFAMYLDILKRVPNAILWLLRFPDLGEQNLLRYAQNWAGPEVAQRIIFTDVAAKGAHITRASVVDLFLDTPECNAHTTAADVVWSGTPIVTWGKWKYKMCSRMAGSIVASALPEGKAGDEARSDLLVRSEREYVDTACDLARGLRYPGTETNGKRLGHGRGRLMDLRRMLWEGRWTSRLFDTERWVRDVERAYWAAWKKWEQGEGGDIWL